MPSFLTNKKMNPALAARLDAWRDALSASIPEEPSDD